MTAEQYEEIEREGNYISKRWYTVIPDNPQLDSSDILYVSEDEKEMLFDGMNYINNLCDKKENGQLLSFEEKLQFAANILPPVFSESSSNVKKKENHLTLVTRAIKR